MASRSIAGPKTNAAACFLRGNASVDVQTSLLVGYRSCAETRKVERGKAQSGSGYVVRRRCSACSVDSCRSFCFVGQPTMNEAFAAASLRLLKLKEMEVDMRGTENDEPEMLCGRGYQQGAFEVFYAIERFLDPATREVLQAWIEKDVFMWRVKAMLGHPPYWRLNMIASPRPVGRPLYRLDLRYAAAAGL